MSSYFHSMDYVWQVIRVVERLIIFGDSVLFNGGYESYRGIHLFIVVVYR